jgi:hypothetical protein
MPAIQSATFADFTGGLNLRGGAFQLAKNESPELLNVDVDPRGGFRLRDGVAPWGNATSAEVKALLPFKTVAGAAQVIAQVGTDLYYSTGSTWTDLGAVTLAGTARMTVFKDRMYVVSGDAPVYRWDGGTLTAMSVPAYNEALETPTVPPANGKFPRAKCAATHMGSVFVANIMESGVAYPNRVRWSHPNFPEDWRSLDFADIDTGHDGDEITALVPFGDRLLVFKKHSIHAIYGEPPEALQTFPVTYEVGAPSQEAVVATDMGVFFYSIPEGVFLYQGKEPRWQFERLQPATLPGGGISAATADQIQLGWGNRRLWLSVPWEGGLTRDRVFVMDPQLGKDGSWTAYDLALGPFLEWSPPGDATQFLAAHVGGSRVLVLDQAGQAHDDFGAGAVHIESMFRTSWMDLGEPAREKRWRAPHVVMRGGSTAVIDAEGYVDYDPSSIRRHFAISTSADGSRLVWGSGLWGQARWARGGDSQHVVKRGASLGNATAVALKFRGPQTDHSWGVDAITFPFIPRKQR